MPSFAVRNFGCRVNQAEAFAWAEAFRQRGLRLDEDWGRGDIVIVNSCTLTGRADRDVRKFIRAVHRENAAARIVVTGCYAERAPGEIAGMPGVVGVLPQGAKDDLAERVAAIAPDLIPDGEAIEPASFRARGWLKIQDGCDNRCSFCIVPSVRGQSRSVAPDEVAKACAALAARGYREVVLAGIHLSSYGEDLEPRGSLPALLGGLGGAASPARLRLSSLDPRKTDRALISVLAADARVCPHFHFSLQHASGRVLGLMGRPVEPGAYRGILDETRRLSPDAALGADMMVGFPGETEADFEELKGFVERSPLTYVHVFSYSPRPGTPAAKRPQVASGAATERARALRRLSAMKDFGFRRRFIGRELEAVVIDKTAKDAEALTGNFIRVRVPAAGAPAEGELVRVLVRRALPRRTEGEIVA